MAQTIALSDAKAGLSSVINQVSKAGVEYIVTVRDKPAAMIVPIPKSAPKELKANGMLAGLRPVATREEEKRAYRQALEDKYANLA